MAATLTGEAHRRAEASARVGSDLSEAPGRIPVGRILGSSGLVCGDGHSA